MVVLLLVGERAAAVNVSNFCVSRIICCSLKLCRDFYAMSLI